MKPPSPATLRRYGLDKDDWIGLYEKQHGECAICRRKPTTGRLCVDHDHVKGWKRMPAEQRKTFVRGLLCYFCNRYYVSRGMTVAKARNVMEYLTRFERRNKDWSSCPYKNHADDCTCNGAGGDR